MTPQPHAPQVKPAALPLVALLLCIGGLCLFPLFPIGFVLAIVSLVKSGDPAYASRKTLAIIGLVLSVVVIPIQGILAAIAIPNFIKFQGRSKQSECKANLKALFAAQKSFYAEKQTYGATAEEIDFAPMGATRYLYIVSDDSTLPPTHPEAKSASELLGLVGGGLRTTFGLDGQCPDCNVTMACVGDPDNDGEPDVWTISTGAREVNGVNVPAGIPHNDVADL
jgi:type IV pilus assembly protein PilA